MTDYQRSLSANWTCDQYRMYFCMNMRFLLKLPPSKAEVFKINVAHFMPPLYSVHLKAETAANALSARAQGQGFEKFFRRRSSARARKARLKAAGLRASSRL